MDNLDRQRESACSIYYEFIRTFIPEPEFIESYIVDMVPGGVVTDEAETKIIEAKEWAFLNYNKQDKHRPPSRWPIGIIKFLNSCVKNLFTFIFGFGLGDESVEIETDGKIENGVTIMISIRWAQDYIFGDGCRGGGGGGRVERQCKIRVRGGDGRSRTINIFDEHGNQCVRSTKVINSPGMRLDVLGQIYRDFINLQHRIMWVPGGKDYGQKCFITGAIMNDPGRRGRGGGWRDGGIGSVGDPSMDAGGFKQRNDSLVCRITKKWVYRQIVNLTDLLQNCGWNKRNKQKNIYNYRFVEFFSGVLHCLVVTLSRRCFGSMNERFYGVGGGDMSIINHINAVFAEGERYIGVSCKNSEFNECGRAVFGHLPRFSGEVISIINNVRSGELFEKTIDPKQKNLIQQEARQKQALNPDMGGFVDSSRGRGHWRKAEYKKKIGDSGSRWVISGGKRFINHPEINISKNKSKLYKYIINPITRKKVYIFSKKGTGSY